MLRLFATFIKLGGPIGSWYSYLFNLFLKDLEQGVVNVSGSGRPQSTYKSHKVAKCIVKRKKMISCRILQKTRLKNV